MEIIVKNKIQISFSKLKNGDVFYSEDCNGYAMKILEEKGMDWNAVSLRSGDVSLRNGELFYIPNSMIVEWVKGKFVED